MVYLDYSATTKPLKEVIDTFTLVNDKYFANPNSLHKLGGEAKRLIDASTSQIADILGVKEKEVIYTSGAVEANNTAIFGVINYYKNRGKVILTTILEHSSIIESLNYLEALDYKIVYLKLDSDGRVDLSDLKEKLKLDVILVSICSVNSETGIKQDIESIGKIIKEYPRVIFHSDVTQSIGKEKIDLSYIDLASFSFQKFFGLKGIGCLIKKENIEISPLIKGGKSTTVYRSGTPVTPLIASGAKALRLAYENIELNYQKVLELNKYLKLRLGEIDEVIINSNKYAIPHIVNISILGIKPETILHALAEHDIYISTRTACSNADYSQSVYALTNNKDLAFHSLRISLSHFSTIKELDFFIDVLKLELKKLRIVV